MSIVKTNVLVEKGTVSDEHMYYDLDGLVLEKTEVVVTLLFNTANVLGRATLTRDEEGIKADLTLADSGDLYDSIKGKSIYPCIVTRNDEVDKMRITKFTVLQISLTLSLYSNMDSTLPSITIE